MFTLLMSSVYMGQVVCFSLVLVTAARHAEGALQTKNCMVKGFKDAKVWHFEKNSLNQEKSKTRQDKLY